VTTGYRTEKNDAYTGDGWYSMPRVGFSYVLEPGNDFAAKLRASWGKSTQALPISYKTGAVSGTILIEANPDLKPQTQYGYELGGDLFYTNNYSLGITYFDQTIDNYAYSITQPNFGSYTYVIQYQNVAKVFNKGVEASFKTILDPFTLDISATGVSSKYGPGNRTTQSSSTAYLAEGNKCIQVPSGSIYAKLSYNIPALLSWSKKGGSIGLDYRWSGSEVYRDYYSYYKTYAETGKYPSYVYKEQKGYSLVGLQFNYAVLNNLSVFLDVQNLLNNQNIVPGYLGILQGRTIGFGFNVTN
jgi:outer membrane receptor protein involved in Fe transport